MSLKIAVAQLNFVVGDMPGNAQRIIDAARTAYAEGFDSDFVERRAGLHAAKGRRGDRGYAGIFSTQAYA